MVPCHVTPGSCGLYLYSRGWSRTLHRLSCRVAFVLVFTFLCSVLQSSSSRIQIIKSMYTTRPANKNREHLDTFCAQSVTNRMLDDQWKLRLSRFLKALNQQGAKQSSWHSNMGRFLLLYLLNVEQSKTPFLLGHHILTVLLFTLLCNKFAI